MDLKDRDLAVIGAGAFLTVLCLLFQWPFVIRIVVGLLVLVAAMIVGLGRYGADKEPLEQHIARRLGDLIKPKKYTYQDGQEGQGNVAPQGTVFSQPAAAPIGSSSASNVSLAPVESIESPFVSAISPTPAKPATAPTTGNVTFDWEEIGIYRLVTVWLVVIGIYFIYWLAKGGTEQIGQLMRTMLKLP
jgi:hypothetical protein